MKTLFLLLLSLSLAPLVHAQPVSAPSDQRVNPNVLAHQQTLIPGLKKLGTRVYGAEFMGYSNLVLSRAIPESLWSMQAGSPPQQQTQ